MKRVSLLLLLFTGSVLGEDGLPRLELGAALFGLHAPDYRGAESDDSYLFPIPYIKYRGDRVRVDDGAKGLLFDSPDLEISISGNFTLPVDNDSEERDGMEELEPLFELGPSINYRFRKLDNSAWWVRLPLRFAYTLDSELEHVGYVIQPRISWRKPARRLGDWQLNFNTGPLYISEEYHDYYYSVNPEDATATRPVYDAEAGFSGWRTDFSYSRRIQQYWLGGFFRFNSLQGAEVEDSPLVFEKDSLIVGIAFGYVFYEE